MALSASCVWRIDAALVLALDESLGPPVDSYVNGSQTWLTENGPAGATLEWRLHPVASFRRPDGISHYDLWEQVVAALSRGDDPDEIPLGTEHRALGSLWEVLECFAAFGEELEPAPLALAASEAVGRAPAASGLVDHDRIGTQWESSGGSTSFAQLLFDELRLDTPPT